MPKPIIGQRIRELRKPRFTQHDLAAAADVWVSGTTPMLFGSGELGGR